MALKLSTGFRNTLLRAGGKSAVDAMTKGYIEIRDGNQPTTADAAETGNLLARVTVSSGDYTNLPVHGLVPEASGVTLRKPIAAVWSGVVLQSGQAGWWRWFATDGTHGESLTAPRLDGAASSVGGQMKLSSVDLKAGAPVTIDSAEITFPTA